MFYEKMKSADKNRDIDAFMKLVHDNFVFICMKSKWSGCRPSRALQKS